MFPRLIAKYFECFDPVYPFIHRRTFTANYESFWASPSEEKNKADADLLGLHYAVYALGTQFMQFSSYTEKTSSAEFYGKSSKTELSGKSLTKRHSVRCYAIATQLLLSQPNLSASRSGHAFAHVLLDERQSRFRRLLLGWSHA